MKVADDMLRTPFELTDRERETIATAVRDNPPALYPDSPTAILVGAIERALRTLEAPPHPADSWTRMADAALSLWGVVANASGGDWSQQTADWRAAAVRARDQWHAALDVYVKQGAPEAVSVLEAVADREQDDANVKAFLDDPAGWSDGALRHIARLLSKRLRPERCDTWIHDSDESDQGGDHG